MNPANPNDYIPFDQLTNALVTSWLITNLGPESIQGFENEIAANLENGTNLTVVTKKLIV